MKHFYQNSLRIIVFWVVSLCSFSSFAQTPTYTTSGTGSNNVFPFGSTSSNKVQWVYLASDFAPTIVAGNITHVFFKSNSNVTSTTYTDLTVKIGYTTQTLMVTGAWITPLSTVYNAPSTTFTGVTTGNWFMITLQTPFLYDGVSNFIVEVSQTAYTTGITIVQNSANGLKRLYGGVAAATGTAGSGLANLGVNIAPANCTNTPTAGVAASTVSQILCGDSTGLSLTGASAGSTISYQWQRFVSGSWSNFGTNSTTAVTPPITATTQFRCRVTCTSNDSFSYTSPITVTAIPPPLNIGNDTSICPGVIFTFNAQNPGSTYLWSTGSHNQSITTNAAGAYSVVVTKSNGCKSYDTVYVVPGVVPQNNLASIVNQCEGDVVTLNAGNTGSTFLWTPGGQTSQSINTSNTGYYSVSVRSVDGCVSNFGTQIIERPYPVVTLGNDTTICDNVQIFLDAQNAGYYYSWSTGDSTQVIETSDSGIYDVIVTSPFNCVTSDEIHISFFPSPYVEGFNFIPLFNSELGTVQFSPLNPTNVDSYEWDFGDGSNHSTQVAPVHTYTQEGDFVVKLRVHNSCSFYEASLPINVDLQSTGVSRTNKESVSINYYPNPASNSVTIAVSDQNSQLATVYLFGVNGTKVLTQTLDQHAQKHQIDLGNLSSGLYTLQVILKDGSSVNRKLEILK